VKYFGLRFPLASRSRKYLLRATSAAVVLSVPLAMPPSRTPGTDAQWKVSIQGATDGVHYVQYERAQRHGFCQLTLFGNEASTPPDRSSLDDRATCVTSAGPAQYQPPLLTTDGSLNQNPLGFIAGRLRIGDRLSVRFTNGSSETATVVNRSFLVTFHSGRPVRFVITSTKGRAIASCAIDWPVEVIPTQTNCRQVASTH
jgi:hypothetical protein